MLSSRIAGFVLITTFAVFTAHDAIARGHSYSYHYRSHSSWYTNVSGHRVHSPVFSTRAPSHYSARCADGSYSFSEHARGTCSHHGGVSSWH